jgi:response regulator RpfG family c-di-GMP phosphodiesterase
MRVVVLMIEVEQPEGLSARKLVLETSKHNVLTAYSGEAGIQLFQRFPNVDAVVVHTNVLNPPFGQVIQQIRDINSRIPIIAISPTGDVGRSQVDYAISSHEPQAILDVLRNHFGASTSN